MKPWNMRNEEEEEYLPRYLGDAIPRLSGNQVYKEAETTVNPHVLHKSVTGPAMLPTNLHSTTHGKLCMYLGTYLQ